MLGGGARLLGCRLHLRRPLEPMSRSMQRTAGQRHRRSALVMDIALDSLKVTILVAAPILAAALISGLLVGILQAATSIQEMTLSFIPKLAVMVLSLVVFGEWQIAVLAEYFHDIFERVRTITL